MEIVIFLVVLLLVFFLLIYFPTHYWIRREKRRNDEYESLLLFIAISLLFLLINYLCCNYYLLNSRKAVSSCVGMFNLVCMLNSTLHFQIVVSLKVYIMITLQLILYFAYAYFVVCNVCKYRSARRRVLNLILFFSVCVIITLNHMIVLSNVLFGDGLEYVSLLLLHAYLTIPCFYFLSLVARYFGNHEIKLAKKNKN